MLIRMNCGSREDHHFLDPAGLLLAEPLILLCRAGNNMHVTVPIYNMEYKRVFITQDLGVALCPYRRTRKEEMKEGET